MERRPFGRTDEGEVEEVTISGGDLTARIITWGAVVRDVRLKGVDRPLVLGFDDLASYPTKSPFFGATVGRCANRIGYGRFTLDGVTYELPTNDAGIHLHGGPDGWGRRIWRIADLTDNSVTLAITSPDGDQGYPGNVEATCRYSIEAPGTLVTETTATTDKATLVNLAQHSYFNLDGSDTILDHEVTIHADAYLPMVDAPLLYPTGEIRPVEGTAFDFRAPRPIRREENGEQFVYDHNFCIATDRADTPRPAVHMAAGGVTLDIASTLPGIQFYISDQLAGPLKGLDGRTYGRFAGCCFEPQYWPDAINHDGFVSPILRPGETQRETSRFTFGRA